MSTSTPTAIQSPRLRAFDEAVRAFETDALGTLVADLEAAGGPLIEPLEGDAQLVTFVYVGPASSVGLSSQLASDPTGAPTLMERIQDTDVWYRSVPTSDRRISVTYHFGVDDPMSSLSLEDMMVLMQQPEKMRQVMIDTYLHSVHDPYNPDRIGLDMREHLPGEPDESLKRWSSVLTLSEADTDNLWFESLPAAAATLDVRTFRSTVFGDERKVTVYTPPGAPRPGIRHPLVLALDGDYHLPAGFDGIVTNLVAAGAIPPPVVAFVYNATLLSRMAEMCCNPDMVTYYADELIPWLRQEYGVSDDPAHTVVAGASYGGLASAWLAYNRSDVFGNVLSMSGSFWWGLRTTYGGDTGPFSFGRDDEPEWLTRQFAAEPVKPIRFWLDAGTLENQHLPGGTTLLTANRHLRTVLQSKGYEVRYHESAGAHDHASWRRTFPEGLRYLLNRE